MSGRQRKIEFSKYNHSEEVIRKALYWLSEECRWELKESEREWFITISTENRTGAHVAELNRLVNDFKLRESLDVRTKRMRLKLIQASLAKIAGNE